MKRNMWIGLIVLATAIFTGCGNQCELSGKVTYADGTPVTAGMVNFEVGTTLSRGQIQKDGSYVVGTLAEADGLPPGTYKVYITGSEVPMDDSPTEQGTDSMGNPIMSVGRYRHLVHSKFMQSSTTPLTCEVPAKGNVYDVIVDPP